MNTSDIELIETSYACPEQYDAVSKADGDKIGYLRLRYGHFTVEVPRPGGYLVYESFTKGDGFFEDDERDEELSAALEAIAAWYS